MNNFKMIEQLKEFFIDLNKEEYTESLECVLVAYDLQSELLKGDISEGDLFLGDKDKIASIMSIFVVFTKDNYRNPMASFKDCSDKILSVGLNY